MSNKNGENVYMRLLLGEGNRGRYKNSNLVIIDKLPKTPEERSSQNISPPPNLNPDYSRPYVHPYKRVKKKEKKGVDPRVLQRVLGNGS
jgi:hypothetical protein